MNELFSPAGLASQVLYQNFNDKTVVCNNQIITGLLLLRTHVKTLSDLWLHSLAKSTFQPFSDFKLYAAVKLILSHSCECL